MNPNGSQTNWEAEAEFWKTKYFETVMHNAQIIAQLARPYFIKNMMAAQMQSVPEPQVSDVQ